MMQSLKPYMPHVVNAGFIYFSYKNLPNLLDLPDASRIFYEQIRKNYKKVTTSEFSPYFVRLFQDMMALSTVLSTAKMTYDRQLYSRIKDTSIYKGTKKFWDDGTNKIKTMQNWKIVKMGLFVDRQLAKIFAVVFHCFSILTLIHRKPSHSALLMGFGFGLMGLNNDKMISGFVDGSIFNRFIWLGGGSAPEMQMANVFMRTLMQGQLTTIPSNLWNSFFG